MRLGDTIRIKSTDRIGTLTYVEEGCYYEVTLSNGVEMSFENTAELELYEEKENKSKRKRRGNLNWQEETVMGIKFPASVIFLTSLNVRSQTGLQTLLDGGAPKVWVDLSAEEKLSWIAKTLGRKETGQLLSDIDAGKLSYVGMDNRATKQLADDLTTAFISAGRSAS